MVLSKQHEKIVKLLEGGDEHTNKELNKICFRFGARIWELRQSGFGIDVRQVRAGLYAYRMFKKPKKYEVCAS
jgi:hypothetical protein